MSKVIGILGGISPVSTAYYYRTLVSLYRKRRGDEHYPEILIRSLDFQRFTAHERSGDLAAYADYIVEGLHSLTNGGADFAVLAANSPHAVFEIVASKSAIPLISIVDVVADHLSTQRFCRVLLLGIRFTLDQGFYQRRLGERGIEVVVPACEEQDEIDTMIFDELAVRTASETTRRRLAAIIAQRDCDAVILGCTEFPILFNGVASTVPLIDTAYLHVEAALNLALAKTQN